MAFNTEVTSVFNFLVVANKLKYLFFKPNRMACIGNDLNQ